ncbi:MULTISPECIES: response regulator [Shewanella]|jgi:two-component system chemotaxis response regulator CheY|uniref:Response regulator receiver protein n=3 Tax=Shewanella putrefaciens TaxID=24 RepID=E6XP39_SHEP2|nr:MULTISPECIES: response regulator [Shewanella]CAD6364858.1 Chemotaxis response regulator protein-glutamate methylesterase [Shewanella hafniensis]ABM23468.1 response regulator receiver protein [Shewanella sp. W3-18-1]AVV85196.1 chemotaxis protein CheY [Shewanella putrefaciens]MCA1897988.1 response regulator [Shewanella putrefaciens]MCK7630755.1 response regulator [Shewanella sp. JNE9-1]
MSHLSPNELSILLVEPSDTQRRIIIQHLQQEGIVSIQTAANIEEAKAVVGRHKPDLIASAMHFEDGTAIDLLSYLRVNSDYKDIQFMLVSSECRREQLEIFRQSGVVAILPKPFHAEHLGKALNATIDLLSHDELDLSHFDVHDVRVLVVDDSRMARNVIKRTIGNLGIKLITEAEDGAQAIELMRNNMFDLVITDYNMPSIDGLALTQFIRNESQQSHIPILMVSSEANDTHLSNVSQAGVNALCDKPFEPQLVKQLLFQLLEE